MRYSPLIDALINKIPPILGRLYYLTGLFFYPEMITPPIFANTVKNDFDNKNTSMRIRTVVSFAVALLSTVCVEAMEYTPENTKVELQLKVPGNEAVAYRLTPRRLENSYYSYEWCSDKKLPVTVLHAVDQQKNKTRLSVQITAAQDVYFNYSQLLNTGYTHGNCQFYMPGFWYRHNLRSPEQAPSFHTSDSWVVREDRLSAPLTGIFDEQGKRFMIVNRMADFTTDALATHKEGDIILSGKTSLGFTGFENHEGASMLAFGFPYREAPKSYIRKLTLAPEVTAFQLLKRGESILLTWEILDSQAVDFSDFIRQAWEYSYDTYAPQPVESPYSIADMKQVLSDFFVSSFVEGHPLTYNSGIHLMTADCRSNGQAEVGFIGRVLLNAFNAWEYGCQNDREDLKRNSTKVFDSYLKNGFTPAGFFKESVNFDEGFEDPVHSIRRQSEGIYAMLHFLAYEKENGRRHPEWDQRMKAMLDTLLKLQHADGSFPRKFRDDFTVVDNSGGSTPSATLPLVMGYKYFKDKRYLTSAKQTADYLEKVLISQADYFSSTLDANCEDKEASLYAATATYYLSLITKGDEHRHYADLARKAAYFALSWYYVWDVPFAEGQMLGDIGLKTRGWGNVSVENNHIDVFVFEFASVLQWLSKEYEEPRFARFAEVISTSMRQLLPHEGHLCGVAKAGYYPEVVQHTNWDYGKNGKGYYNDIFAPGWTVASLWELFTPGRAEHFLK